MKAIILAAGMGRRMRGLTKDKPKCMLDVSGKSLLSRQVETLKDCGIIDISIVAGYKRDKIRYNGLKFYVNDDYHNNNILNSLFYAEEEMNEDVIISYSDILFERTVVEKLMDSDNDISIVVDTDWRSYYEGRNEHPIEEAESVIFDSENKVVEIGKILKEKSDANGEFIGMVKFSKKGTEIIKDHFHRAKKQFWDRPYQKAKSFQKAYLTDIIQDMTDSGIDIHCVLIQRGWMELDTVEDFQRAEKVIKNQMSLG